MLSPGTPVASYEGALPKRVLVVVQAVKYRVPELWWKHGGERYRWGREGQRECMREEATTCMLTTARSARVVCNRHGLCVALAVEERGGDGGVRERRGMDDGESSEHPGGTARPFDGFRSA